MKMTFLAMDKDILTLKLQEQKFIGVRLLNQPLTGRNITGREDMAAMIGDCRVWTEIVKDEEWICKGNKK
jgi:hypothetical protein